MKSHDAVSSSDVDMMRPGFEATTDVVQTPSIGAATDVLKESRVANANGDGFDADVIVVGAGPAGLLSAILLARRGYSVHVIERHGGHFALPRAITFDDEVARILSGIGIDADNDPMIQSFGCGVVMKNGRDEVLAHYDWRGETRSGWQRLYWFNQPELEQRLLDMAARLPRLTMLRGREAVSLTQDLSSVTLEVQEASGSVTALRAKFLIGADGANSFVRTQSGLTMHDLGFHFDWLVVDIKLTAPLEFDPPFFHSCDPARPTTVVPAGPGRRRWEFMLLPGESAESVNSAEAVWALLAKWGATPANSELERHVVWRFQARWAEDWRSGRVLIAGDAAHLMPPFAGQGMCAALRDASNLSWKLDHVLSGLVSEDLLDTYGDERKGHVRSFIDLSVGIGKVICITDPAEAERRDAVMKADLAANGSQPATDPNLSLGRGVWTGEEADPGKISVQGRVRYQGREGRFDEVVGRGWIAIGWQVNPSHHLSPEQARLAGRLGMKFFEVTDVADGGVDGDCIFDISGTYRDWFDRAGGEIILIRPDCYVSAVADRKRFPQILTSVFALLHLYSPDDADTYSTPAGGVALRDTSPVFVERMENI